MPWQFRGNREHASQEATVLSREKVSLHRGTDLGSHPESTVGNLLTCSSQFPHSKMPRNSIGCDKRLM